MPVLGRNFELPKLPPEDHELQKALRIKGIEVRTRMNLLLPYRGLFGARKTGKAKYHAAGEASDTVEQAWLERAGKHSDEPIKLMFSSVTLVQNDGGVEWLTKTMATVDFDGYLIDKERRGDFPIQLLAFFEGVADTVAVIEAQVPPAYPRQQLGRTALNG